MADNPRELIAAAMALLDEGRKDAAKIEGSELPVTLASLRSKLQDIRESVLAIQEEGVDLRERVKNLEAATARREDLVRHRGVYWARGDVEPWCPVCWEKDQRALHLNRTDLLAGRLCQCPACGYNVNLDNTDPPAEWLED